MSIEADTPRRGHEVREGLFGVIWGKLNGGYGCRYDHILRFTCVKFKNKDILYLFKNKYIIVVEAWNSRSQETETVRP